MNEAGYASREMNRDITYTSKHSMMVFFSGRSLTSHGVQSKVHIGAITSY